MLKVNTKKYPFVSWEKYTEKNKIKLLDFVWLVCWNNIFKQKKKSLKKIEEMLVDEIKKGKKIFPYPQLIFNTFNMLPFRHVQVVILGQDPYKNIFDNVPEAMGLSFSVPQGMNIPPSLRNIYQNLSQFKHIKYVPENGNLTTWNIQGCLMINSGMTLQEGVSNSHQKIWEEFSDFIIKKLSTKRRKLVFVLWGAFAAKKKELINEKKHKIIITSHPSPLSYNKTLGEYPSFVDYDTFGEINKYLISKKKIPINWQIP